MDFYTEGTRNDVYAEAAGYGADVRLFVMIPLPGRRERTPEMRAHANQRVAPIVRIPMPPLSKVYTATGVIPARLKPEYRPHVRLFAVGGFAPGGSGDRNMASKLCGRRI